MAWEALNRLYEVFGKTRGHPRGSCPTAGSPRRSTGHKPCIHRRSGKDSTKRKGGKMYCTSKGFVTLLNSRQENIPPGLSTRCASHRTSGIEVTFRIAKRWCKGRRCYSGNVSEGSACAFPSIKSICGAAGWPINQRNK
jgi:hypothetical protein